MKNTFKLFGIMRPFGSRDVRKRFNHRLSAVYVFALVAVIGFSIAACSSPSGSSSLGGPPPANLLGRWFDNTGNAAADTGSGLDDPGLRLVIGNGTISIPWIGSGTIGVTGNSFTIIAGGDPVTGNWAVAGNVLTISNCSDSAYNGSYHKKP